VKTLALLFLAVPAFASTLTDPVPDISTACTVGGVSVTCGSAGKPMIYGSENVGADTSFSMTGLGTNTGITIIATAAATAGTTVSGVFCSWGNVQFRCGDSSAGATVSLDFLASTDGPQRLGIATYLVATDTEKGGAYDSIGGLGSCQFADCVSHGILVPFQLGVPFEVILSLHSGSGGSFPTPLTGAGSFWGDPTPVVRNRWEPSCDLRSTRADFGAGAVNPAYDSPGTFSFKRPNTTQAFCSMIPRQGFLEQTDSPELAIVRSIAVLSINFMRLAIPLGFHPSAVRCVVRRVDLRG